MFVVWFMHFPRKIFFDSYAYKVVDSVWRSFQFNAQSYLTLFCYSFFNLSDWSEKFPPLFLRDINALKTKLL